MTFRPPQKALGLLSRFLFKVGSWGLLLGLGFSLAFQDWHNLPRYILISTFFTALIGGGFQLLPKQWMEPVRQESPARAALRMQGTWLGLCLALVGLGLFLLEHWMGPGALEGSTVLITLTLSLLLTSLTVGRHTAVVLVTRTQELERARTRAGFLALRAQLQPHTIFNALNAILARVRPDPEGAEQDLRNLAALLRQTLVALERETWTLGEECSLLRPRPGTRTHQSAGTTVRGHPLAPHTGLFRRRPEGGPAPPRGNGCLCGTGTRLR
jgi:hypothetical protein